MKTKIYGVAYYDSERNYIVKTSINPFALKSKGTKGIKDSNIIDDKGIEVVIQPCLLQEKHLHLLIRIANENIDIIMTGNYCNINDSDFNRFYENTKSYRLGFFKIGKAKINDLKLLYNLKLIEMTEKQIETKHYKNVSKVTDDGKAVIHHIMQIEPSNYNKIVNRFLNED